MSCSRTQCSAVVSLSKTHGSLLSTGTTQDYPKELVISLIRIFTVHKNHRVLSYSLYSQQGPDGCPGWPTPTHPFGGICSLCFLTVVFGLNIFYLYTLNIEQHIKTNNNIQYTNGIQKKVFRLIRICDISRLYSLVY